MRLIKNEKKSDQGSGQCREITNSGSRCSRDSVCMGFCRQHYKLRVEKGLIVEGVGNTLIEQMPDIPEDLDKLGRRHFQIYCQHMIDQDRLYQIYVMVLKELCYLEEQLEKAKEQISEYGAVNFYDTGTQVSGHFSQYEKTLRNIRNLRKDLGLTSTTEIVKVAAEETKPKQSYQDKKKKGWV